MKEYTVPVALDLPDGRYQVEAWLTTEGRQRQFSAMAPLPVRIASPANNSISQPFRARTR
jgi:hypothetical protein